MSQKGVNESSLFWKGQGRRKLLSNPYKCRALPKECLLPPAGSRQRGPGPVVWFPCFQLYLGNSYYNCWLSKGVLKSALVVTSSLFLFIDFYSILVFSHFLIFLFFSWSGPMDFRASQLTC